MTPKHYTQHVDLDNGYLEASRDDTDEIQDLHFAAYLMDGSLPRKIRKIYNIQYDYSRYQEWKYGVLIEDCIVLGHRYGHLMEEGCSPTSYPDNFEPVKPEGAEMFHLEGIRSSVVLLEHKTDVELNFYIFDDLEEWRKPGMNLITHICPMKPYEQWYYDSWEKRELERLKKPFDPEQARKDRIEDCKRHEKEICTTIPLDPRFID